MQSDLLAATSIGLGVLGITPLADWAANQAALLSPAPVVRDLDPNALRTGDRVTVHFIVRTAGGKEIANTYKRGLAYTVVFGDPAAGEFWKQALVGLKPGAEAIVAMPSEVLFGPQGVPPIVGPGIMLQATVKLVKVQRASVAVALRNPQR